MKELKTFITMCAFEGSEKGTEISLKKHKIGIKIILIMQLFLLPITSYSAFYDIDYPPNSSGKADYTEQEAEEEKEKAETHTSEEYIGKSGNNYLESLVVENATMEPAFHRQYVDYTIKLENETNKKIKIIAKAEDEKAKVEGTGEIELQDGINQIRVVVTAENGNVQIYTLTIELPFKQSDLTLENLEIYGVNIETGKNEKEKLNPSFNKTTYKYTMEVPYEITSLDIKATSDQNSYIAITGENDLEMGKNKILIEVIDKQDDNRKTTYLIEVVRKEKRQDNWANITLMAVLIFVIMPISIILVRKRKK